MWQINCEALNDGRINKLKILRATAPLKFNDVVDGWKSSEAFRHFFNQLLADVPFKAFFWEMPPLTRSTLDQMFECIVVDSPALAGVHSNAEAFAAYFKSDSADEAVVGFPNLGHDAYLVAPLPVGALDLYPHLATFVRGAPATQQQAFWKSVGISVVQRLCEKPLWLSTSGLGVYWLHVRLDSFPKYYTYEPYTLYRD